MEDNMARPEKELDLYYVDKKYIRDLSKVDDRVLSVSPQAGKETRPFVGIVVIMEEKEYCIPLTSPKSKFDIKSHEDFIKIPDPKLKNSNGAPITIGILNLNNMIPVSHYVLEKIDLSQKSDIDNKRCNLLRKEIEWCRTNIDLIRRKANKLYEKVTLFPDKDRKLTKRCVNFKALEEVLSRKLRNTQKAISEIQSRSKALHESDEILRLNSELNQKFQQAKKDYLQNHPDVKSTILITGATVSISDQLNNAQAALNERCNILKSNQQLKSEYIAAKKAYRENTARQQKAPVLTAASGTTEKKTTQPLKGKKPGL